LSIVLIVITLSALMVKVVVVCLSK